MNARQQLRGVQTSTNSRKVNIRPQFRFLLIVCEGLTEALYFNGLIERHQLNGVEVAPGVALALRVEGQQGTTTGLVEKAIHHYEAARTQGVHFEEVWCVFDYDGFASFDKAVEMCTLWSKQYPYLRAAWSNEAFELWYVLHFQYLDTSPSRGQKGEATRGGTVTVRRYYIEALEACFQKEPAVYLESDYSKVALNMYELLYPLRAAAIRNAKNLLASRVHFGKTKPSEMTPATTVHELVCLLLQSTPDAALCETTDAAAAPPLELQAQRAGMAVEDYAAAIAPAATE